MVVRTRFAYDGFGQLFMSPLGMGPGVSWIDVGADEVVVRLGWGFRAVIPRSAIRQVSARDGSVLSRGAHGWAGRWLVNGAGRKLVTIAIDPPQRAYVTGFPIRLRELTVSAEVPGDLIAALAVQ